MALFPTPTRKPDTSSRDKALDDLARAGERLLALRRETILATQAFRDARAAAGEAIAAYRDASGGPFYTVESKLPSWPWTEAGEGFTHRRLAGEMALHTALAEQDRAERNWRSEMKSRR